MKLSVIFVFVVLCIAAMLANPLPGSKKYVKHRIHVPTKIHTVFVTKFVKVPEHHHHHHFTKKEHHHHHHPKHYSFDHLDNHKLDHEADI